MRKVRIGRSYTRGLSFPAKDWHDGAEFVTCITRRPGIVLEHGHDHVAVGFHEGADVEVKRVHPSVLLQVP